MQPGIEFFNVRVYFIIFNENRNAVLVSDEIIRGQMYTKFPGGGLEKGEGLEDAVRREALEELGQEVEVVQHFYTTSFFIRSAFNDKHQVIPIYYEAQLKSAPAFRLARHKFDFLQTEQNEESFRWVPISSIDHAEFAFDADKEVVRLLKMI
jgi:ADP-ribose pyrophosphatase YjhB (NUDIX family)